MPLAVIQGKIISTMNAHLSTDVEKTGVSPSSHGVSPSSHGVSPSSHGVSPSSHGVSPTSHLANPLNLVKPVIKPNKGVHIDFNGVPIVASYASSFDPGPQCFNKNVGVSPTSDGVSPSSDGVSSSSHGVSHGFSPTSNEYQLLGLESHRQQEERNGNDTSQQEHGCLPRADSDSPNICDRPIVIQLTSSAYQVRIISALGIFKGILIVDRSLPENTVGIRQSMHKVQPSNHCTIDKNQCQGNGDDKGKDRNQLKTRIYMYVNSLTYAFGWSAFLCSIRFCDTLIVIFFE
jgi:hypothetical protein